MLNSLLKELSKALIFLRSNIQVGNNEKLFPTKLYLV
ncbi:hypothetical protein CV669_05850 [Borreliella burgdorferi]|nr:hypothetical protein CV669_05850 [Borreliella burgdorferi]